MKKITLVALIVFMGLFLSSCAGPIANRLLAKGIYPSYDETVAAWPKLREDYGRVIFYYRDFAGLIFNPAYMIEIHVDDYQCPIMPWQFIFDDLPAGSHTFRYAQYHQKPSSDGLTLNIRVGEITYVEVSYNSDSTSNSDSKIDTYMRIVDEETALNTIATSPQYTYARENIKSCMEVQLDW